MAMPAPNAAPVIDSAPVTTATAGQPYQLPGGRPRREPTMASATCWSAAPAGMTVTRAPAWSPGRPPWPARPRRRSSCEVYDSHGSHATLPFTIAVSGVDLPAGRSRRCPSQLDGQEGQTAPGRRQRDRPAGTAARSTGPTTCPPGAVFDPASETLTWLPGAGQAGTYPDVTFFVSDGVNQVERHHHAADRAGPPPPTLVPPADRTVLEGEPIHIALQASDPNGDPLTYSSTTCPAAPRSTPIPASSTGRPATTSTGSTRSRSPSATATLSTTETATITVLNVDAPPVFDDLGAWQVPRGSRSQFRAFALDPNNPGFVPPDAAARRHADAPRRHRPNDHLHRQRPARRGDVRPRHGDLQLDARLHRRRQLRRHLHRDQRRRRHGSR